MRDLKLANNFCPHCGGKGLLPHKSVGFELHVGDIVEDHCGLKVRIDKVWEADSTVGWGTTFNAPLYFAANHRNHRVQTDNDYYEESLWKKVE